MLQGQSISEFSVRLYWMGPSICQAGQTARSLLPVAVARIETDVSKIPQFRVDPVTKESLAGRRLRMRSVSVERAD